MKSLEFLIVVAVVGFLAQLVDGTLGMGYGVTSSTLLISLGLAPAIASASVHFAEVFVALVSGASHFRLGNARMDIFLPLAISGIIGGVAGAYFLVNVPNRPISLVVGLILLAMGFVILYRFLLGRIKFRDPNRKYSAKKLSVLGFFAAMIDAIGGGGWGPVCTPTLVVKGAEPKHAIGSVNLAEFFVSLAITITFIILLGIEKFRLDIAALLLVAGIIAAPIAAYATKKLPHKTLGVLVGIIVIALSARIIAKALGIL
ncbi:MAG: sulfite exporter TauE/SafE family protein [Candidatus Diapherotrites archaeon]|uniref:Probable membrane transporter protein n=1 Tax=Candidatus Iainarchaeum sp. TaxID=3101447 RepID=A0A8T4KSL3_9ARCH|nr:sulfite exporter TauE/SafE family protein [Candidatus Diapherotrites archaeon]